MASADGAQRRVVTLLCEAEHGLGHDQFGVGMSDKVTGIRDDETISCAAHLYGTYQAVSHSRETSAVTIPFTLEAALFPPPSKKGRAYVVMMVLPAPSSKYGSVQTGALSTLGR